MEWVRFGCMGGWERKGGHWWPGTAPHPPLTTACSNATGGILVPHPSPSLHISPYRRRIGDLQDELASRDKDLAARASEIQELHAERRALTEQARADHRHLIQELEKHKEKASGCC